jgi:hypothetical protein
MGTLIGPKILHLHEWFIKNEMRATLLDTEPIFQERKKKTNIQCPFCKKGELEPSKKAEPVYSGGLRSASAVMHHTGNNYEFKCSNPACRGLFLGSVKWIRID